MCARLCVCVCVCPSTSEMNLCLHVPRARTQVGWSVGRSVGRSVGWVKGDGLVTMPSKDMASQAPTTSLSTRLQAHRLCKICRERLMMRPSARTNSRSLREMHGTYLCTRARYTFYTETHTHKLELWCRLCRRKGYSVDGRWQLHCVPGTSEIPPTSGRAIHAASPYARIRNVSHTVPTCITHLMAAATAATKRGANGCALNM